MKTPAQRLQTVRTRLMLTNSPKLVFMANLLQVPDVMDASIKTACTDGTSIRWNEEFINSIDDGELLGVMIHELMHIGLLHTVIAANFDDHERLNIAADLAVNSIIAKMGLKLPKGGLLPGQGQFANLPLNKSLEYYYRELQKTADDQLPEPQPGELEAAGSQNERETAPGQDQMPSKSMMAEIVKAMVRQAAEKTIGAVSLPEVLGEAISAAFKSKVDYRDVLRKYRTKLCRGGSDWNRPNRRVMASGVSIARNRVRKVNSVLVLLDCSGSMSDNEVAALLAEVQAVFCEVAGSVHVWQHDTKIVHKDEMKAGQPVPEFQRRTHGGTCHRQPFADVIASDLTPDLIICGSDMETRYPDEWPECDVLWLVTRPVKDFCQPPVGEVIEI